MDTNIPTMDEIRAALAPFGLKQIDRLSERSGVPATTIYKIKRGETGNPGIETVRMIVPHIRPVLEEIAAPVKSSSEAA